MGAGGMVIRLQTALRVLLWVLVMVIRLPTLPALVGRGLWLEFDWHFRCRVSPGSAGIRRISRPGTHLLLKPEGGSEQSRTLLPLWQRVQLLVLPVAYT